MKFVVILLTFAVFVSALSVIWMRHQSRLLFIEWYALQQEYDQLNEQGGQLQLEQSTLTQPYLIEERARELQMTLPSPEEVVRIP